MPGRPLTVEDLWALPRVGSPEPAPDGSRVIVPVTTYNMETNEATTRLWLIPATAGDGDVASDAGQSAAAAPPTPRPLTTADASASAPSVSPDGNRLAFVRKPSGPKGDGKAKAGPKYPDKPQVYVMPLDGGEPERLTDLPLGATQPRWLPDGRRLALMIPLYADALTVEGTAELAKVREEDPVKVRVTEDRVYRYWDHWLTEGKLAHLFILDTVTGALLDLMPDSKRWLGLWEPAGSWCIAPDGREIVFTACRTDPPYDSLVFGIFTVAVPEAMSAVTPGADGTQVGAAAPAAPVLITTHHEGPAMRPVYSPDGRWIVYGIQREIDFYADPVRLVAYDRAAGTHSLLTEVDTWDRSASGWTFDEGDPGTIYLSAEVEAQNALFALDLAAALADRAASPPREIARDHWLGDPKVAGGRIFATRESLTQPPEIVVVASGGGDPRALTDFTGPQLAEIDLGPVEEIMFTGAEGHAVQMFVVHPPQGAGASASIQPDSGDSTKAGGPTASGSATPPLPLVHMIHGGPHGAFGDQWHWRWNSHAFAAPGYVVALVNFHGSTGWGDAFTRSILGRWGDQPYTDVMTATDLLIERGLVDPNRMAITGGSYGGYLVSWICGQSDRFRCAINHAGVCDFQTQFASDITQGRRRSMGGELWEDVEGLDRYNPIRHAQGFHTPMLVIHGTEDYRVPYNQGLTIYNVYKALGLPARLVVYPDENHWILKPKNSRHWYGEVLGWLGRWLG